MEMDTTRRPNQGSGPGSHGRDAEAGRATVYGQQPAEVNMSSTNVSPDTSSRTATAGAVDLKLEIVVLPVADVDRAKNFYEMLGWRLDADFSAGDDFRVVQVTPPASPTSIIFGKGITSAQPGSVDSLVLAVADLDAARDELVGHGVDISEVFHDAGGVFHHAGTEAREPGPDPQGRSYASWASFSDPDGNTWLLQEIKDRLPGRVWAQDTLATDAPGYSSLLHETAERHDPYEKTHSEHNWWDWYGAYMDARQQGSDPDEAAAAADQYMRETLGVLPR